MKKTTKKSAKPSAAFLLRGALTKAEKRIEALERKLAKGPSKKDYDNAQRAIKVCEEQITADGVRVEVLTKLAEQRRVDREASDAEAAKYQKLALDQKAAYDGEIAQLKAQIDETESVQVEVVPPAQSGEHVPHTHDDGAYW